MPSPRNIVTWDFVKGSHDPEEAPREGGHIYSWDTKGEIADAINEAADGVVTVSQNGNYYAYGDAIRQMKKKIWSSASTAPKKTATKTFPNLAAAQDFVLKVEALGVEEVTDVTVNADQTVTVTYETYCVIRNDDLQYGKWSNYGYIDINEISESRFGDYDKYHAASSFYIDIYNPPVYVNGNGGLLVGACTLTNKVCTVTDTEIEASTLWNKFATAYPNNTDIFPGDANSLTIRPIMLNYDYTTLTSTNTGLMTLCNAVLEKVSDDYHMSWQIVEPAAYEKAYIGRGSGYNDGDIISMLDGENTKYFRKTRHSTRSTAVYIWYDVTDKVVN